MSDIRATVEAIRKARQVEETAASKIERQMLDFIRSYSEIRHRPPTFQQIADAVGLKSKGTVSRHIKRLAAQNAITLSPGHRRSIQISQAHALTVVFPVELWAVLIACARRAGVTPEAVIIEAVRDREAYLRSLLCSERAA